MPRSGNGPYEKVCEGCEMLFSARMVNQRFCKPACARVKTFAVPRKCQSCGEDFLGTRVDKKVCGKTECLKSLAKANSLSWRVKMLGMTHEEYWKMFEDQGGLCAICSKPETYLHKGKLMNLSIDHCHTSGKVRGLLCARCNHGLGHFADDVDIMMNAIKYLQGAS